MFLFPLMKKRSAANPLAALRGLVWATDFTEGADAQVLYNTIDGDTVGTGTGQLGSTSGSDGNDPSWDSAGMSFVYPQWCQGIGSVDQFNFITQCDSNEWSIHCRAKITLYGSGNWATFFGLGTNGVDGSMLFIYKSVGEMVLVYQNSAFVYGLGSLGNDTSNFISWSATCDGTNIRFYKNGSLVGTSGAVSNGADPTSKKMRIHASESAPDASCAASWIGRCLLIANVEHDADEVAAIHTLMSALPNAA